MIVIKDNLRIHDTNYVRNHQFGCGHEVPIYDVYSCFALNQILGHVKFNNRHYGNVYYRGECELYPTLKPSLMRRGNNPHKLSKQLTAIINRIDKDDKLQKTLNLSTNNSKHIIEGMLQHYGVPTRNIDLVDNHWIALWMGLFQSSQHKAVEEYHYYFQRQIPYLNLATNESIEDKDLYQYVLLVALPYAECSLHDGVRHGKDFVEIDLRQALPSIFVRPHAQHGVVVKRKPEVCTSCDDYDLASQVCAIFRIRIDRSAEWLGKGQMLTPQNMFPPPLYDGGYDRLLKRTDIFRERGYSIKKYV